MGARLRHAGHERMSVREDDEREAVAVIGGVDRRAGAMLPRQHPGVATGPRVTMRRAQEGNAVLERVAPAPLAEVPPRHGEVHDEAGAGDQVTRAGVVHGAVVPEEVEEAAVGIDAARMVEGERLADVIHEERPAAKVRRAHGCASTSSTSARVGA